MKMAAKKTKKTKVTKNAGWSDIVCIVDKSGSMRGKESDVIGGFNKFLAEQKDVPGDARISLVLFDTEYQKPYTSIDLKDAKDLTDKDYRPSGMTALLDAIGTAVSDKERELEKLTKAKFPEHIIVVIITDGEENDSHEYSKKQITDMITKMQDKHNWKFIFLGANQDAFAEAGRLGIKGAFTTNYSGQHTGVAFAAYSNCVGHIRGGNDRAASVALSKAGKVK